MNASKGLCIIPSNGAIMKEPLLSGQFEYALAYAAHVHRAQPRKGTDLPYAGHLLSVAGIVLHNGGTEQEAIAALLHDAPEDQGGHLRLQDIASQFGPHVARIVEACSDSLEQDPEKKEEWRPRKERYLRHLRENPDQSVYLVSAADKLDNARATLAEWLEGVPVWNRFKVGREQTLWLYDELIAIYEAGPPDKRRAPIVRELKETVVKLKTDANQAAGFRSGG
jgi:(p)ppGpp synthase/HD superfamily hydrolase